jgi:DNA-binding HxlR family transcriptional regulator
VEGQVCPHFHAAVELIGARWSGAILRALMLGHTRFAEIRAAVPGLSDTMLSQRLRELEAAGVVHRQVAPSTPVRIEYSLTPAGAELGPVLDGIVAWAHRWLEPETTPRPPDQERS